VSPVKYELGFYIPEDDILHSHCREKLRSYLIKHRFDTLRGTILDPEVFKWNTPYNTDTNKQSVYNRSTGLYNPKIQTSADIFIPNNHFGKGHFVLYFISSSKFMITTCNFSIKFYEIRKYRGLR
jgi:hypothetical protein